MFGKGRRVIIKDVEYVIVEAWFRMGEVVEVMLKRTKDDVYFMITDEEKVNTIKNAKSV
jgi:hypothetical protein